jgi:hypothetical protein
MVIWRRGAGWGFRADTGGGKGEVRDKNTSWIKLFMAHGVSGHQTILHPVLDLLSDILVNKLPK